MDAKKSKRIIFLCSGGGGNLAFIKHAIQFGYLKGAIIVGVITDRRCSANVFSDRIGLYNRIVEIIDQNELQSEIEKLNPDLIITTFHKIIEHDILNQYEGKLINLHYSLLPAFSGLIGSKPLKAALEYHALFNGVTVHLVNAQVDAGRPLVQGVIALHTDETLESLMPVVFRCGCIALLLALIHKLSNSVFFNSPISLDVLGHTCLFNGSGIVPEGLSSNEKMWKLVQKSLYQEQEL